MKFDKKYINSYKAYKQNRAAWSLKGYSMDKVLSLDEYVDLHRKATANGMKNIAREFAKADRQMTKKQARNILRDYKIQDIDTTQYTAAEVERYNTLSKALKKGTVKDLIGMGLGRYLFQTLVMGGITYKEAEQIIYSDDE